MSEKRESDFQLETFKKNYLALQKKYENKIIELSIIKEMSNTMQQVDFIDQDVIWVRQLECLKKYKGLEGALLYFSEDNDLRRIIFLIPDSLRHLTACILKKQIFSKKLSENKKKASVTVLNKIFSKIRKYFVMDVL